MENNPCDGTYEDVFTGKNTVRYAHMNIRHGLVFVEDPYPVALGHITIATLACKRSVDLLPEIPYKKLYTGVKYAGLILEAAYPESDYIGEVGAGKWIRHPHRHRFPAFNADWALRFGNKLPRLEPTPQQQDDMHGLLTTGDQINELWEQCDAELDELGATDPLTIEMMDRLSIPIVSAT